MQTPLLAGVFWQQLAKSGLLSREKAAAVAREFKSRAITTDAKAAEFLVRRGLLTQYQVDRLMEGRSRGFFFDNFRVLDLLGAGGMGWVYRAADTTTEEVVALKVLLDRLKEDRGMVARFQQEARAGLLLNHPHIVRTRATGSAGGMMYMIMDFVEGPSLLEILLRVRRLPWAIACDFARQAALGLHHAHQHGLVHRDVKPQNVLVDQEGHVKLLDFGLAMRREGEGGDEFSMAMIFGHECIGTPAFMAPEQAVDSMTADARSDVYGLGCTLYAALTGDTPFPLRNPYDVVKAHQTQIPRSVRDHESSIPHPVADIVARMLAKRPDDRFQTAEEAAAALAKWSKSGPVEFNFEEILAERSRNARERVAELHKSRPFPSGSASSTTRLGRLSSVAKSEGVASFGPGKSPRVVRDEELKGTAGHVVPTVVDRQMMVVENPDQPQSGNTSRLGKILVPVAGGASIPLIQDRIVIGRSGECDIQIMDGAVSGRHCELYFDGVWWWITDLKSRNGIGVNGKPTNRRQLEDRDTITIANNIHFRLQDTRNDTAVDEKSPGKSWMTVLLIVLAAAVVMSGIVAILAR